jgi:stringent starvation protein B
MRVFLISIFIRRLVVGVAVRLYVPNAAALAIYARQVNRILAMSYKLLPVTQFA